MKDMWFNGIMGAVVGDALGVPFEFKKRGTFECTDMAEYGTHRMPKGTWSDDSSMILATMDSIAEKGKIDEEDIMAKFVKWLDAAEYCPFDKVFDCGVTVQEAIREGVAPNDEYSNGNGALMRILPICLYSIEKNVHPMRAKGFIHEVSGLTHGHIRSKVGCGIYYCIVRAIVLEEGTLEERIQKGIELAQLLYKNTKEKERYARMFNVSEFMNLPEYQIKSSGYVVDSLEAAVWCLLNSKNYKDCVIKAVNLGEDTDTVACIAGGLAGLYYKTIPTEWIDSLQRLEFVNEMIEKM